MIRPAAPPAPTPPAAPAAAADKRFGDVARIELGAWTYSGTFPSLTQVEAAGRPIATDDNDDGVYGLVEARHIQSPAAEIQA